MGTIVCTNILVIALRLMVVIMTFVSTTVDLREKSLSRMAVHNAE